MPAESTAKPDTLRRIAEAGLDPEQMPAHIAVIMDGNGRWAKQRLLPRVAGHRKGVETVRATVRACIERGVDALLPLTN